MFSLIGLFIVLFSTGLGETIKSSNNSILMPPTEIFHLWSGHLKMESLGLYLSRILGEESDTLVLTVFDQGNSYKWEEVFNYMGSQKSISFGFYDPSSLTGNICRNKLSCKSVTV